MRHLLLPILSLLLLAPGCKPKPPKAIVPPLPSVKMEDVSAPASVSVTIPRGSNLREVAATAYGNEDFSGFVAALNGLADPARVAAGAVLKTPSLPAALHDAGLDPAYQPTSLPSMCWPRPGQNCAPHCRTMSASAILLSMPLAPVITPPSRSPSLSAAGSSNARII